MNIFHTRTRGSVRLIVLFVVLAAAVVALVIRRQMAAPESEEIGAESSGPPEKAEAPLLPPVSASSVRRTVQPGAGGDFTTISAALNAAKPGDTIVVRPGTYTEFLTVQKAVGIEGDGPADKIVIEANNSEVIRVMARGVRIAGVSIVQNGKPVGDGGHAIDVVGGAATIENCDIGPAVHSGVAIRNNSVVKLAHCTVHDCKETAVYAAVRSSAVIEENTFENNGMAGLAVFLQSNAHVHKNKIHANGGYGIVINSGAKSEIDENSIDENEGGGIEVKEKGHGNIHANTIFNNGGAGMSVAENSGLLANENDVYHNAEAGADIRSKDEVSLQHNKFHDNAASGIYLNAGKATLEKNEIFNNHLDGMALDGASAVTASENKIHNNWGRAAHVIDVNSTIKESNDTAAENGSLSDPPSDKDVQGKQYSRAQKAWALAASAVLNEKSNCRHDMLGCGIVDASQEKESLRQWWEVTSRKDLIETVTGLESSGHNEEWMKVYNGMSAMPEAQLAQLLTRAKSPEVRHRLELVKQHGAKFGKKGIRSFDLGRAILLCRWGYRVGYFTEDEAWSRIMPLAKKMQATFDSWQEMGENYLIGRDFWSPEQAKQDGKEINAAYLRLLNEAKSPWKKYDWKLELGPAGK